MSSPKHSICIVGTKKKPFSRSLILVINLLRCSYPPVWTMAQNPGLGCLGGIIFVC